MRAFNTRIRSILFSAAIAVAFANAGCAREEASGPKTLTIAGATDLPAVYTPQQCADVVSQFPGWAKVAPVPEKDSQGLPTIYYAAITITNADQIAELASVGIYTDDMPIFMDQGTRAKFDGKVGYVSKSTCGGAEIVWALVPGFIFNRIAQDTVKFNETLVEAIVFLPLADSFTDASVAYQGIHPVSHHVLHTAGFNVAESQPSSQAGSPQAAIAWSWNPIDDVKEAVNDVTSGAKDVVQDATSLWNSGVSVLEKGLGWVTCEVEGCVNLTINLDLRNTDPAFGGQMVAGGADGTTPMLRTWGGAAGGALRLPGVTMSIKQSDSAFGLFSVPIRFDGTTDVSGTASVKGVKGKNTDVCLTLENYAATVNDEIHARMLCDFAKTFTTQDGDARQGTQFESDGTVNLRLVDKYVNVLAQLTDGYDYLKAVAGYTPRKAKVLSGWPLELPGIKQLLGGRAVTPCLNFPNVAVDAVNSLLDNLAEDLPFPFNVLGYVLSGAIQATYEDDIWLPDNGETLTSRGVISHEYGHFAMCSLLYDEDWTKMVTIPSLIVQRALQGSHGTATDDVAYIMEGWADFFAGQLVGGANYFDMQNELPRSGPMAYCDGAASGPCWDWNYVDDSDGTDAGGSGTYGFLHQVRRVATTLFDAFDGHPFDTVAPGEGDFWTQAAATGYVVASSSHHGNANDENVTLPGSGLRDFIHNWTHGTWPLGWRVDEQQFFGSLAQTIRNADKGSKFLPERYNWCDVCKMFSQHDGLSCSTTGNISADGLCVSSDSRPVEPAMSIQQMVAVCEQSASIPGFIGAPPTTDPQAACTFTGCAPHTVLVGELGVPGTACVACGAHQVSTGSRACPATECPAANVSATTCVDCPDDQIVGGSDGNTCVACPALQIPNTARTACVACAPHQIASGTVCVDCPNDQIAAPNNSCQSCPAGQMPYSNTSNVAPEPSFGESCMPATDCTCTASYCRAVNSAGICQDHIG